MAILRAGPWGNLTDSFQAVPSNTGADGLTFYPVNCAKADWPSQKWAAYYEVEAVEGCCTPAQIEVTFPATDNFGSTFRSVTVTIDRGTNGDCYYEYVEDPGGYYRGDIFILVWNGSSWLVTFGNEDFAQADNTTLVSTDECDPVETLTISDTYYYDGQTITITDPNA